MCGICGVVGLDDKNLLVKMRDILTHRGPDGKGIYIDENVMLGHRRLSIIDLVTGNQPMSNEDESIWLVYNGEIYNFDSLKKELKKKGHNFKTNSDTEVILHLYEDKGEDFVRYLDGMFAFALWDSNKKELILARDSFGIKPLYYALIDDSLFFSSELKSFLQYDNFKKEINHTSLSNYFTLRYIPGPETIFKNIHNLQPGNILKYRDKKIIIKDYWKLNSNISHLSKKHISNKVYSLLENSIKKRLIADVPLGAYLSGGIDSSTVVGIMGRLMQEPVKTFSVGFGIENFDETPYAKIVSDYYNTDHHEMLISPKNMSKLPKIVWYQDNLVASETMIPIYFLSKLARKYVKVILNGDASDEVFGGYEKYRDLLIRKNLSIFLPKFLKQPIFNLTKNGNSKFFRAINYTTNDDISSYLKAGTLFTKDEIKNFGMKSKENIPDIIGPYFDYSKNFNYLHKIRYVDIKYWLPDLILTMTDRMGMANSVEARIPFLDKELVKFIFNVKSNMLIRNVISKSFGKYILRSSMKDLLPKEILTRKKQGFNVPLKIWYDKGYKEVVSTVFDNQSKISQKYIKPDYVQKLIKDISKMKKGRSLKAIKLYILLTFEVWHKIFIEDEKNKLKSLQDI